MVLITGGNKVVINVRSGDREWQDKQHSRRKYLTIHQYAII